MKENRDILKSNDRLQRRKDAEEIEIGKQVSGFLGMKNAEVTKSSKDDPDSNEDHPDVWIKEGDVKFGLEVTRCETPNENKLLATLKTWADKERQEENSYILSIETILKEHNLLCFCICWPYKVHEKKHSYKLFRKALELMPELILKKIEDVIAFDKAFGTKLDYNSINIKGDFPMQLDIFRDGQQEAVTRRMVFIVTNSNPLSMYDKFIDNRWAVEFISRTIEEKSRKYQNGPTEIDTYLALVGTFQVDSSKIPKTISSMLKNKEISYSPFKKVFFINCSNEVYQLFP